MFDFRLFPGTNFNRINLDWIFSKLKELQEGQSTVTEAAEEATEAAEEATAAAAAATQAASDAIEAIETVTETAEDAQTRAAAAEVTAARAEASASSAGTAAAAAQQTATNAGTAAAAAQQSADQAASAAATAQQTATNAGAAAAAAQQSADDAEDIATAAAAHAIVNVQIINSWVCVTFAGGRAIAFKTFSFTTDITTAAGNIFWSPNALDLGSNPSNFFDTTKTIHRFYSSSTPTNSIAWCAVYGATETAAGSLRLFRATSRSYEDTYYISALLIGEAA